MYCSAGPLRSENSGLSETGRRVPERTDTGLGNCKHSEANEFARHAIYTHNFTNEFTGQSLEMAYGGEQSLDLD